MNGIGELDPAAVGGLFSVGEEGRVLDRAGPIWVLAALRDDRGDLVGFRVAEVNDSAAGLVHRSADELLGTVIGAGGTPFVSGALFAECRRVVDQGESFCGVVEWFDGEGMYVDVRLTRFGDGCVIAGWDVTESKRAEQVLEVVDSAVDAVVGFDVDSRIVFWSGAARRMYGWTIDEALGEPASLLSPDEELAQQRMHIAAALAGEATVCESIRRRKDGTTFPAEITVAPVFDRAGRVIRTATVHRDITERAAADDALASLQERLRMILDNSRDAHTVLRGSVVEWCSPAIEVLLGIPPAELVGRDMGDFVHPDDRHRSEVLREHLDNGQAVGSVVRMLCSDGTSHWVDVRVAPVESSEDLRIATWRLVDDQVAAVAELEAGRAALAASERRYRLVVENSRDAITITVDGVLRWASPAFAEITGTEPDLLIGRRLTDLVHDQDVPVLTATSARIVAGLGEQSPQRIRIRHADRSWHWVELRSGPHVEEDGTTTGAVSSWRIIDDQVAYIDALARSEAENRALAAQLQTALDSRVLIEQAKGMVAVQCHVTPDEAFGLLRDHGRRHSRRLHDVAHDVVELGLRI